jgi:hypothetical protein
VQPSVTQHPLCRTTLADLVSRAYRGHTRLPLVPRLLDACTTYVPLALGAKMTILSYTHSPYFWMTTLESDTSFELMMCPRPVDTDTDEGSVQVRGAAVSLA